MKNLITKILILVVLALIPFAYLTNASFNDGELTQSNYFGASSLDFEILDDSQNQITEPIFYEEKLQKETVLTASLNVVKTGYEDFDYWPYFEFESGEEEVCSALELKASREGIEVYSGSLSDFDMASSAAQITGGIDEWEFEVQHDNSEQELQGENCEFDITFQAYQDADNPGGFSDTEKVTGNIGIAYEPDLSVNHNTSTYEFEIELSKLSNFISFDYELTYDTDTILELVNGAESLSGENDKNIDIILGTCSGSSCTYHVNPHNFSLTIELLDIDGHTIILTESL